MTTITYAAKAFIRPKYETADDLMKGIVRPVLVTGSDDYWTKDGYVHVANATVTLDRLDDKTIHKKQLDGLSVALAAVRADNQRRENAILDQISKLQAIGYTEPA